MSGSAHESERIAREVFGPDVVISSTEFPSGALDIVLRWRGHFAVIQGKDTEWGLSVDIPDGEGFTGHDQMHGSLDEALRAAKTALATPKPVQGEGGERGWLESRLPEQSDLEG
ncbi:hypothetical protein JK358_38540 [Nocardia sp. 2]|uniref:Uncharacterized protein n=1 Tax=Nocardia acididurans TaxID=2802282 RepID=A0ABS1MI18_9NOCA|nr:hypothetical protein [Nocardia acididurans]MBL1080311.1 hypothetical protein [Nocardia acididurans]